MKRKLTILGITDDGMATDVDWLDNETGSIIESHYMGDNRLTVLDALNAADLTLLKDQEFWASLYKDRSNNIRVKADKIYSVKSVEEKRKTLSAQSNYVVETLATNEEPKTNKNFIMKNPSLAGRIATEYKQKYRVLRKLKEAVEYAQENNVIVQKYIPHFVGHIQNIIELLKGEKIK